MNTDTTNDSLNHQERKRRRKPKKQKRPWVVWLFFSLATSVILCKAFDVINGALN